MTPFSTTPHNFKINQKKNVRLQNEVILKTNCHEKASLETAWDTKEGKSTSHSV